MKTCVFTLQDEIPSTRASRPVLEEYSHLSALFEARDDWVDWDPFSVPVNGILDEKFKQH